MIHWHQLLINFTDGQKIPGVPSVKATLGVDYEIVDGLRATADLNYYSNAVDNYNKKNTFLFYN